MERAFILYKFGENHMQLRLTYQFRTEKFKIAGEADNNS